MFKIPKGTHDIIKDEMIQHLSIIDKARIITSLYGFQEWTTPIFEETALFQKNLGVYSDVVSKEMYKFDNDELTLRPEGTAGVCRALITNGLTQTLPQRVFYQGPMFRRERPQKGRYRQFHQVGIECIGIDGPKVDAEIIQCANDFLKELKVDVQLNINSLGDKQSQENYSIALCDYYSLFLNKILESDYPKLMMNPIGFLDTKDKTYQEEIVKSAPEGLNFLNDSSKKYFDELCSELIKRNIDFTVNPRMYRGLDYYDHTIFEFISSEDIGKHTVLAGGRYNRLINQLGGPSIPAIGWAAGVERLSEISGFRMHNVKPIIVFGKQDFEISRQLRNDGLRTEISYHRDLKACLKYANKVQAEWVIFTRESELEPEFVIKRMHDGKETVIDDIGLFGTYISFGNS